MWVEKYDTNILQTKKKLMFDMSIFLWIYKPL